MPRLKTLHKLCIVAAVTAGSAAWLAENAQAMAGSPFLEEQNGGRRISQALARIDMRGGALPLPDGAGAVLQSRTVCPATATPSADH